MKIPCFHKFYSINIFLYIIIVHAISITGGFFIRIEVLTSLLLCLLMILTDVLLQISIGMIFLELILRKFKYIKNECRNIIGEKFQKIIYVIAVIATFYTFWFWIYYYPIIEQRTRFD